MAFRRPTAMGAGVAITLAAVLALAACGADEDSPPTETAVSLRAATAERLAQRSERIAEELDSGDTCAAAHSADELDAAVADAEIPAELRPGLEAASEGLVNSVNCPPPPEPEEKEKEKKDREKKQEEDGPDEDSNQGPSGEDGDQPPGQEKKYEDAELIQP
jgi:hypothetical protein